MHGGSRPETCGSTPARWRRTFFVALCLCGLALTTLSRPGHATDDGELRLLTIDGVINPLTAQYLTRGLRESADARASAVIVRLNTPGGLASSMREMTQAMLNSPVPVVVYVAPPGAQAASAGMFITLAAHLAAMAPGTNIGAAHPVGLGSQTDPVMTDKLVNDAAASARAIAAARGRNSAWAEQAVRESVSITAEEALDQGVVDLIAGNLEALQRQLDGREVTTAAGPVTLRTAQASVVATPMTLPERLLQTLADPNIAYLLMTIGAIGIIAELYSPGTLVPGITGAIALVLAFMGLGTLPTNWAGVLLLLLAFGLLAAELLTAGVGILAVGGVLAFVLGSMLLFVPFAPASPTLPEVRVHPGLIAAMTAVLVGFVFVVLRALLQARRAPVVTGAQTLIGRVGVAASDLTPAGTVQVESELWSAVAADRGIRAGDAVRVVDVEGVTLRVQRPR